MVVSHGSLIPDHKAADKAVLAVFLFDDSVKTFACFLIEEISLIVVIDPAGLHETCFLIEEILLTFDHLKA